MALGKLTSLQERVLVILADLQPAWTLTGGGALAGFYTQHRVTRDLDLFFRGQRTLGSLVAEARERLEANRLSVNVLRSTPSFAQLAAQESGETLVIDLVADPTPIAEAPRSTKLGSTTILVDTTHQLLVNKLCALLSRSELRDLVDVQTLLANEGDLDRALRDAPLQDGGFSPLTFAWCLRELDLRKLGASLGWTVSALDALDAFRADLIDRVLAGAHPSST